MGLFIERSALTSCSFPVKNSYHNKKCFPCTVLDFHHPKMANITVRGVARTAYFTRLTACCGICFCLITEQCNGARQRSSLV
jgi:hypothetical protein